MIIRVGSERQKGREKIVFQCLYTMLAREKERERERDLLVFVCGFCSLSTFICSPLKWGKTRLGVDKVNCEFVKLGRHLTF